MKFDVLIIGAGASGVSCALVLGSAKNKSFANNKKIGIISHQKASAMQNAVFYNAFGITSGKLGSEILTESLEHLTSTYPEIKQLDGEKVLSITKQEVVFQITTNKNIYFSEIVVVAIGGGNPISFEGLEPYIIPHQKIPVEKNRIQLKNIDHLVEKNLYVAGVLAGHRSQLSIAAGSGAAVATDILTLWNDGKHTMIHDAIEK